MKKLIALACIFVCASTYAASPATGVLPELTMAQVQNDLPTIKDSKRRTALIKYFNECKNKRLFSCHLAWFDLHEVGLDMVYNVQSGMESWVFEKDPKSTELYRAISIALSHPAYRDGWDLVVRPRYASTDLPSEAPARLGLHDDQWYFTTLDIVTNHFASVGITYATDKGFKEPRADWIRYLALSYAIRGDVTNTYAAIGELKSYAKINKDNVAIYNATLSAVQKYFSNRGVSK